MEFVFKSEEAKQIVINALFGRMTAEDMNEFISDGRRYSWFPAHSQSIMDNNSIGHCESCGKPTHPLDLYPNHDVDDSVDLDPPQVCGSCRKPQ